MMSPEEARERRKQLGKMRMLESYYESKCKRMKKIKSKKYRKLRRVAAVANGDKELTAAQLAEVCRRKLQHGRASPVPGRTQMLTSGHVALAYHIATVHPPCPLSLSPPTPRSLFIRPYLDRSAASSEAASSAIHCKKIIPSTHARCSTGHLNYATDKPRTDCTPMPRHGYITHGLHPNVTPRQTTHGLHPNVTPMQTMHGLHPNTTP